MRAQTRGMNIAAAGTSESVPAAQSYYEQALYSTAAPASSSAYDESKGSSQTIFAQDNQTASVPSSAQAVAGGAAWAQALAEMTDQLSKITSTMGNFRQELDMLYATGPTQSTS